MHGQMRLEQKMKLSPQMIQSMEILQMPLLALEERIEQELSSNPVLELEGPDVIEPGQADVSTGSEVGEAKAGDGFDKLESLDENFKNYVNDTESYGSVRRSEEPDTKLEALKNTEARGKSLTDHLLGQWVLLDTQESARKAGEVIIGYIDERGYLKIRLEQLRNKDNTEYDYPDLEEALKLVQTLEPAGVGARDIKECLLIQINNSGERMDFERRLVSEYMDILLENRLPEIARKMKCSVDEINKAIERLSKFDTSPGLQVGQSRNHQIRVEVIVEPLDDEQGFSVKIAESDYSRLKVNEYYAKIAKDKNVGADTRSFLQKNIRSANWLMSAVGQRKNTLHKVAQSIVKNQLEFFEKGERYLRPLPMSKVADEVGIHLATVSRAVAGKYLQCPWGILPLRKFFSGGTEDANGEQRSWEAIRVRLQEIIDNEDKSKPLSDEGILKELAQAGMGNIARRTVAKYRKLMNIPPARMRKRY